MSKPSTKKELLDTSKASFKALCKIVDNLSARERIKPWKTKSRDQNLRDLLYHLHAWHELMIHWVHIFEEGGKPIIPKDGYTWDELDELNHDFWQEAQQLPFMEVYERLNISYKMCYDSVKSLDEEKIFTAYYPSFQRPIISLLDGCMREHYQWALNEIKKHYNE